MKTKAIPKIEDDTKKDYFTDYLDKHIPIPETPESNNQEYLPLVDNEDVPSVNNDEPIEEYVSPLDVPLRYDDIYTIIDSAKDSVLIEGIPYTQMIAYTANFMLWGFMLSVKNSVDMEIFAFNADNDDLGSPDEQVIQDIVNQYWLYVDTANALSRNKSIFNHLKIKRLILSDGLDFESAKNRIISEETGKILQQQNAVIKAMPGLITKAR